MPTKTKLPKHQAVLELMKHAIFVSGATAGDVLTHESTLMDSLMVQYTMGFDDAIRLCESLGVEQASRLLRLVEDDMNATLGKDDSQVVLSEGTEDFIERMKEALA